MNVDLLNRTVQQMLHSRIKNYVVPGVESWLVGDGAKLGKVRLFRATRDPDYYVWPHSHRYDFFALVLKGNVENTVFTALTSGEPYFPGRIARQHDTPLGKFVFTPGAEPYLYYKSVSRYSQGQSYSMSHDQIHSIKFDKGTEVLVFESAELTQTTTVLEACVDGQRVPTFTVADWMFQREAKATP